MNELELLTHWTTHLNSRCTRAVSYATPAYYAHWAARRGKILLKENVLNIDEMSKNWLHKNDFGTMYFI
jgi:hypothetical protein